MVYHKDDYFGKEDEENGNTIQWLITDSQKNIMEPVKLTLRVNGKTPLEKAHNGEEFGYVLKGQITLLLNDISYIIKEGESFYYPCTKKHQILNSGSIPATFLWVSAPPSF